MSENLLTTATVAERLGVSSWTVRALIRRGEIRAVRLGYRTVRITEAALAAYIQRRDV